MVTSLILFLTSSYRRCREFTKNNTHSYYYLSKGISSTAIFILRKKICRSKVRGARQIKILGCTCFSSEESWELFIYYFWGVQYSEYSVLKKNCWVKQEFTE